jgi:SAM-dependent methyltransferase
MKAKSYVGWLHLYERTNDHQFKILKSEGLREYHRLLDVGAGCLGIGKMLIEYLKPGEYYAIEPNLWLIQESGVDKSKFNHYSFDDFKLTRIRKKFDFILAHSIFTHADRAQIKVILKEAKKSLKKGGKFLASFYDQGNGDSEHKGWLYPAGVAYTSKLIKEFAEDAGFEVKILVPNHPAGHKWLICS